MNRRRFVTGLIPASILVAATSDSNPASAHIPNTQVLRELERLTKAAERLEFDVVSEGPQAFNDHASGFRDRDKGISQNIERTLRSVKDEDLRLYVRSDAFTVTEILEEYRISLRPDPGADTVTYDRKTEVQTADRPRTESVILAIVIESFGVSAAVRQTVVGYLLGKPEIETLVKKIAQATKAKRWNQSARLIAQLIDSLANRGLIAELVKLVGKQTVQRILVVLAARCVPFIGNALLVAGVVAAIYRNWDDIKQIL